MMVLLFKVKEDRYAIDVVDVVEVIPRVPLQALPRAPVYVIGLLNYRGAIVPVVDLSQLICDLSSSAYLSSRIILIQPVAGEARYIGLLAESISETIKVDENEFTNTGVDSSASAFVDKVTVDAQGIIQHIDIERLLPEEVKSILDQSQQPSPATKPR